MINIKMSYGLKLRIYNIIMTVVSLFSAIYNSYYYNTWLAMMWTFLYVWWIKDTIKEWNIKHV
jgi:hypothetical protein